MAATRASPGSSHTWRTSGSSTFFALLLLVPAYLMVGLRTEPRVFLVALLCVFVSSCVGCTAGILVGAMAKDLQAAQGMMMPLLIPLILFCGYVIPKPNIPEVFRWINSIDPFQWTFSILRLNQFDGWVFEDCPGAGAIGAFCVCNATHAQCTGADYLRSVDLDPAEHRLPNYFLYLCIFLAVLMVPTFLVIRLKGNTKTG